jgi:hypothetical protein
VPTALGAKSETYVLQLDELFLGISPQYGKPQVAGVMWFKAQ